MGSGDNERSPRMGRKRARERKDGAEDGGGRNAVIEDSSGDKRSRISIGPGTASHQTPRSLTVTMDFDESSAKLIPPEFLAVVLAGFGNECESAAHLSATFETHLVTGSFLSLGIMATSPAQRNYCPSQTSLCLSTRLFG